MRHEYSVIRDGHYRELGEHLESLVDLSSRLAAW